MHPRIGVDESGKGDYFGYLVVAGVFVDEKTEKLLKDMNVRDSKRISDDVITELSKNIRKICPHDIVKISPEKYNALHKKFRNLNKLLAWAHARAIENLLNKTSPKYVITDKFGDEKYIKDALLDKGKNIPVMQKIRAESDIAVAAASIIARAEFLRTLRSLSLEIGYKLPKGASHVDDAIEHIMKNYQKEVLNHVAKLHFKNSQKVIKKISDDKTKL